MKPTVGKWVKIERDEEIYPSKGSWPNYKGKVGRVVSIFIDEINPNYPREEPYIEYGVRFTAGHNESLHWFVDYELTVIEHQDSFPSIRIHAER
jgi:hypothetical protein